MAEPTLTTRALQPVVAGLEALGVEVAPLLAEVGIPQTALGQLEGRIRHAAMMRLWQRAGEVISDPDVGLHVAVAAPLASFEIHGYALSSCATLGEAFHRACRYQRLIHDTTDLSLETRETTAILRHGLPGGEAVPRQPAEFLVAVWVRFGRLLLEDDWQPARVDLAHPRPAALTEHHRLLGTNLRFTAGRTAIELPASDLERPNRHADPTLAELLDRFATSLLAHHPAAGSTAARLRAWLLEHLADGEPGAAAAASHLARSVRSLHRDLRAEGTSYRAVVDQLRHERAIELLDGGRASLAEIAFLLGFAELSSFHRAFRRWTGATPGEYRGR